MAVNVKVGQDLLCSCGGALAPHSLPRGMYELSSPEPCDSRLTVPSDPCLRGGTGSTEEEDLGYGASHGYDPTHGGPTGPGDAPATAVVEKKPRHQVDPDTHCP